MSKNKFFLTLFYVLLLGIILLMITTIVLAYPVYYNGTSQQSIVILHNDTGCFMQINQDLQNCNGSNIFTLLFPYAGTVEINLTNTTLYVQNYTNFTIVGNCTNSSIYSNFTLESLTVLNGLLASQFLGFQSYITENYVKKEVDFQYLRDQYTQCNNTFINKDLQIELEKSRVNFTQNNLDECKGNSRLRDYLIIGFGLILILTFAFVLGAGYFKRRFGGGQQIDLPGLIAEIKQQVQKPEIKDEIQEAKVVGEPLKFPKPPKK